MQDKEVDQFLKDIQESQKQCLLSSLDFNLMNPEKRKRTFSQSTYNSSSNFSDSSSISNRDSSALISNATTEGENIINNSMSIDKGMQGLENSKQCQIEESINSSSSRRISMMIKKKELIAKSMGSTANIVYITPSYIYLANIGDSYSVMYANGIAVKMNEEHKTTLDCEKERILNAGLKITNNRVEGKLNLTRAFGKHITVEIIM